VEIAPGRKKGGVIKEIAPPTKKKRPARPVVEVAPPLKKKGGKKRRPEVAPSKRKR
jgi:hypothetical protein